MLILLISLPFDVAAQKTRWYSIGTDDEQTEHFLDTETFQKTGSQVSVWMKAVAPDGSYRVSFTLWLCGEKKFRVKNTSSYSPQGKLISSNLIDTDWIEVTPDTSGEVLYHIVCLVELPASPFKNQNAPASEPARVRVTAKRANARKSPRTGADVVDVLERGTVLPLTGEKNVGGWYQIRLGKTAVAWIHRSTIEFVD